jgi:hypothetical protein
MIKAMPFELKVPGKNVLKAMKPFCLLNKPQMGKPNFKPQKTLQSNIQFFKLLV